MDPVIIGSSVVLAGTLGLVRAGRTPRKYRVGPLEKAALAEVPRSIRAEILIGREYRAKWFAMHPDMPGELGSMALDFAEDTTKDEGL